MNPQNLSSILSGLYSSLSGLSKSLSGYAPNATPPGAADLSKALGGLSTTLTGVSKSIGSGGVAPQTPSPGATTIPSPQAPSKSTPAPVTIDSLMKAGSQQANGAPTSVTPKSAPAYVPWSSFGTPSGWTQTTTPTGGTAYLDSNGNMYVQGSGGFQLVDQSSLPQASPQYRDANGNTYSTNGGPKNPNDTPLNDAAKKALGLQVSAAAPTSPSATPSAPTPTTPGSTPAPTGSSTPAPTSVAGYGLPTANLQPGATGDNVTALQQWLAAEGYSVNVNGQYDSQTQQAVWQLQQALGMNLSPDEQGFYGPKTQAAILAAATSQGSGSGSGSAAPASSVPGTGTGTGTNGSGSGDLSSVLSSLFSSMGLPSADADLIKLMFGPGSALDAEQKLLEQTTKTATEQAKGDLAARGLLGSGYGDKEFADAMAQLGASNAATLANAASPYLSSIMSLLTMKPTIIPQGAIAIDPRTGNIIQQGAPRITSIPFGATPAYSGPLVGGGSSGGGTGGGIGGGSATYTNAQAALLGLSDQQATTLTKLNVPSDVWGTIAGIVTGQLPPTSSTRSAAYQAAVNKGLIGLGFNVSKATTEWNATQAWAKSANSGTQLRLRQAIGSVRGALSNLSSLNDQWNRGGFGPFNSAVLKTALSGAMGQSAQSIAAQFQQQLTLVQDELGQTFMGGNSPTDKALSLAQNALSGSWSQKTLTDAIANLDTNLGFRQSAIESTGAIGGGTYSPNAPVAADGTASFYLNQPYGTIFNDGTMQYTALGDGTAMGSDGNIYVDDGSGNIVPQ